MAKTRSEVTPEILQIALSRGKGVRIDLDGLQKNLVMVDWLVFDMETAEVIIERDMSTGAWFGYFPSDWLSTLENTYRANFG